MKAIVDCNSFYCSCERLFRPDLENKPVVVLSNNDGCIISRTDEAKKAGVGMASPYYQNKDLIEKHNVAVFSSNYNLYGDLSQRVMDTIRTVTGYTGVEVYSVDEAFVDLSRFMEGEWLAVCREIKEKVEQWTGIKVSIGAGQTKVLSKTANRLAKKNKDATGGILVLANENQVREALECTRVDDIWGVGRQYAVKLHPLGIDNGWQLRNMPEEWARKNLGGVVGVRLIRELNGQPCIPMKDPLELKKMIATTRMFGKPVTEISDIREAVATYVSRAAEKLRRQLCVARHLDVFVVTNGSVHAKYEYKPQTRHRCTLLAEASAETGKLIAAALPLVEELFEPGLKYLKAGVVLSELAPDSSVQSNLFIASAREKSKTLMEAVDNINFSQRNDIVKYVATGLSRNWKMRQELRSGRYTSRWEELFTVN